MSEGYNERRTSFLRYVLAALPFHPMTVAQWARRFHFGLKAIFRAALIQTFETSVVITYASVSGTTAGLVRMLARELNRRAGVHVKMVASLEAWNEFLARSKVLSSKAPQNEVAILFVVPTTGEGQPPAGWADLVKGICQTTNQYRLTVRYAVFGVGDRRYQFFCGAATATTTLLSSRKQEEWAPLLTLRCGDAADKSLESSFDAWAREVMHALRLPSPQGTASPLHDVNLSPSSISRPPFLSPPSLLQPTAQRPLESRLCAATLLAPPMPPHLGVWRLRWELPPHLTFQAGDYVGIFPAQPVGAVKACLLALRIPLEQWSWEVERVPRGATAPQRASAKTTLPATTSLWNSLQWHFDLSAPPTIAFLQFLRDSVRSSGDRRRVEALLGDCIKSLSTSEEQCVREKCKACQYWIRSLGEPLKRQLGELIGQRESLESTERKVGNVRSVLGCVQAFTSHRWTLSEFMEVCPRTTPRFYSIASDPLSHGPGAVEVFFREVEGGLCSAFLRQCAKTCGADDAWWRNPSTEDDVTASTGRNGAIPLYIQPSHFRLPHSSMEKPLLFVGTGSGAGAIRGLCLRRHAWRQSHPSREKAPADAPCWFLVGCRQASCDQLISDDEAQHWLRQGVVQAWLVAESRSPNAPFHYVTDALERHAEDVYRLFLSAVGGRVYVCGSARTGNGVRATLEKILRTLGGMSSLHAKEHLKQRYVEDVY